MTIDEKLKEIEQNEIVLANSGHTLIKALRKAIHQRNTACHIEMMNSYIRDKTREDLFDIELLKILGEL